MCGAECTDVHRYLVQTAVFLVFDGCFGHADCAGLTFDGGGIGGLLSSLLHFITKRDLRHTSSSVEEALTIKIMESLQQFTSTVPLSPMHEP